MALALAIACAVPASLAPVSISAQNLPNLGDTDREELSPQMERKLGEEIMRDIRRDRDYLDDGPLNEYLNYFGSSLVAIHPEARGEAGYDYNFFAVRDPMLNAFALPGGFIGVHSALILAAQSESELASVLAHEIGHVSQRHIARMIGQQKQDALIPLAAMVMAALAARSSSNASAALMMGGQGYAMQRQLSFSRDAEREADRVGLQILGQAGFDTSGMISFFGRLQNATRAYNDSAPAYLRSHPLTTERIADIQARTRNQPYRQHADTLDFHLIRARTRVLQDLSPQGLRDAGTALENQLQQKNAIQTAAAKYGLAFLALRQGALDRAQTLLQESQASARSSGAAIKTSAYPSLAIDIKLAARQPDEALREAKAARERYPLSRGLVWQYADALIAGNKFDEAITFLRDQAQLYRSEQQLQDLLARAYAAQGKQALQHMALAESYALSGSLLAALDQLGIARRSPDASFYDQAVIDARERELQTRWREESKAGQAGQKGK
ncbi:Putative Zn-dependent protease, contains TPR repeats [Noviherbaspirillum humi]|uniref:Putative Zn-dependent protease, contains TPR repeats n=1 Tax=Noviherbaspirillum humi TaxID=1688639 RepID=A0A239E2N7_9BURK|nr:Putative Zn-dependent protease, contains TPR repeats [Noviherbaspirillum humi]